MTPDEKKMWGPPSEPKKEPPLTCEARGILAQQVAAWARVLSFVVAERGLVPHRLRLITEKHTGGVYLLDENFTWYCPVFYLKAPTEFFDMSRQMYTPRLRDAYEWSHPLPILERMLSEEMKTLYQLELLAGGLDLYGGARG